MPAAPPIEVGAAGPAPPEAEVEPPRKRQRKRTTVVAKPRARPSNKKSLHQKFKIEDAPMQLEDHLAGMRTLYEQKDDEIKSLERQHAAERAENRAEVLAFKRMGKDAVTEIEILKRQNAFAAFDLVNAQQLHDENLARQQLLTTQLADKDRANAELQAKLDLVLDLVPPPRLITNCVNCGGAEVRGSVCDSNGAAQHEICNGCLADFAQMGAAAMMMKRFEGDAHLPCTHCPKDDRRDGVNITAALRNSVEPDTTSFLLALENFARVAGRREIYTNLAQENQSYETPLQRVMRTIREILGNTVRGCGHVYADFEGCLMLTCAFEDCANQFCGFCDQILLPGTDGHDHVRHCAANPYPGEVFLRMDLFKAFKKMQRGARLEEYFATLDPTFVDVNAAAISELVQDLIA